MNKKLLSLVLAIVVLSVGSVALAAPSIGTGNMTTGTTIGDYGTPLGVLGVQVGTTTSFFEMLRQEISAFIADGKPVYDYFSGSVTGAAPANAAALKLNEMFPISVNGFAAGIGDVDWTVSTATQYTDGQALMVMIATPNGSGATWTQANAEVVGGKVVIHFTEALLAALAKDGGVVAILG